MFSFNYRSNFVVIICIVIAINKYVNGENRVIGGSLGSQRNFNYLASIQGGIIGYCGAVIIHEKFCLTAAHCTR